KSEVLKVVNKMELAYNKGIPVFTNNFFPPNVWKVLESKFSSKFFEIKSFGGFEDSERRIILFNNLYNSPYPIKILKISAKAKFRNVKHRDFLGAITSLGIERNRFGDLIQKEDVAYVAVIDEVSDYIINNLTSIATCPCTVDILKEHEEIPSAEYVEEVLLISSLRLDSLVAKLTNLSRGKSQTIIEQGKVLLDYSRVIDKSKEVVSGQRITIRGTGKFLLGDVIGNSKSGKLKIIIKKYT
ncbi:MAG: RNA-binding protein, partial [Clostridium sp.]